MEPIRIQNGGAILVDKPSGPTSHDVVARIRKALDIRKVGHAGTLDPFATGLLVVLYGAGTRLAEYLSGLEKHYRAVALLGETTDTLDPEGEVVERDESWRTSVDEATLRSAMEGLIGEIQQIPPQFSAKKVGGEAMYRRARRGETIPLEPASVRISSLELEDWDPPRVQFTVTCSTGTYVRALARDLGAALGTVARLEQLRRTAVGFFSVERAVPFEALDDRERVLDSVLSLREAVGHLPAVRIEADDARKLAHGQSVPVGDQPARDSSQDDDGPVTVFLGDDLAAVGRIERGMIRPRKVFVRV